MNVVFHTLAAGAIASSMCNAFVRHGARRTEVVTAALALLSHGVLDGLPHRYPLAASVDVLASLIGIACCLAIVDRTVRPLFALAFASAIAPDCIDLGPAILARWLSIGSVHLPGAIAPWHRLEGSGSRYGDDPRDALVSYTNHAIVIAFSLAAIATTARRRTTQRISGSARERRSTRDRGRKDRVIAVQGSRSASLTLRAARKVQRPVVPAECRLPVPTIVTR